MTKQILTSPQELETWLDELMAEQMNKLHIPGVTFSIVQNGDLFFAKGYGYADLEKKRPVIADRTVFRVGGISMLLTATAIMQLVEKELINLDDNVNKYLPDFQLDNNFPEPVTIAHLLTLTAGFDYRFMGLGTLEAENIQPMGKYLAANIPKRIRASGKVTFGGCNYSHGLLGYLVELVTDIPFNRYIAENILRPLEMNHSSFDLPSSEALNLASSYRYQEKQEVYRAFSYEYTHLTTANINTTATDIAKLAISHLQYGKFKNTRILAETTARQMQQQQFTNDSRLPSGVCWGFAESQHNRQRILALGGRISGFESLLYLIPESNIGLFVSANASGNIPGKLMDRFLDRYCSVDRKTIASSTIPENKPSLQRYEGSYRSDGYTKKTIEKITLLFSPYSFRLKLDAEGKLSNPKTLKTANPVYIQEVEPLLLQITDRPDILAIAKADNRGKITNLLFGNGIINKLAWYETNTFHWILICFFISIFLSGFIVSLITLIKFPGDATHQIAQLLSGVVCGLNLLCAVGMLILDSLTKKNYQLKWVYGLPKIIPISLSVLLFTSVLALGLPIFSILAWIDSDWSYLELLHYSLISLTAISLIPWLNYWNLLGFRY